MAGQNRRTDFNRRPSDFHDRHDRHERRHDRDRPYLERSPARGRGSPYSRRAPEHWNDPSRPRGRDRDRDIPLISTREPSSRSPAGRSKSPKGTPIKPKNVSGLASGKQNTPKADADVARTTGDANIHSLTNLICEKASCMQKREDADKRLAKLRADHARSSTKHLDFPTVTEMFQDQIKTAVNELAMCNKQVNAVDEKLQSEFGHVFTNQILSSLAGQTDAPQKQEPPRGEPPDTEKQQLQVQTSTSEPLSLQLDNKLNELQRKFENDLRDLKTQFEATGNEKKRLESENQELRKSHHKMTQKLQHLEENLDQLERRSEGGQAGINLRITAMFEQVHRQIANMTPGHQTEPEPLVSEAQLKEVIEQQNGKIAAVHNRIGPALVGIEQFKEKLPSQLEELKESGLKLAKKIPDISELNSSVSDHGARISNQQVTLDTLAARIESLQSLVSETPLDKIRQLLEDVSTIQKGLEQGRARTDANPMTEEKVHQMLKLELATAVEKLSDPNTMTEEQLHQVLKSELANAVDKLSKQKDTASTDPNPNPNPNPMTEERVCEILKPELVVAADKLQNILDGRLIDVANRFGKFIDQERNARVKTDKKVSTLDDSVSSLQKEVDGVKALTSNVSFFQRAVDELKTDHDTWKGNFKMQFQLHGRDIEGQRYNVSALGGQVEELRGELRRGHEGHQMQLVHLSSWMNTFNTRRMYNDIVAHIHATNPTGVGIGNQMRALSERVDALESRGDREDEDRLKKRKAVNGNAVVVNNSR